MRDAIVAAQDAAGVGEWHLPVVGETYDGVLNDIAGMHVRRSTCTPRSRPQSDGPVEEGAVGGGTGMICHGFKGGIGTASRSTEDGYTVGVLVQANHGRRARLSIDGVRVGRELGPSGFRCRRGRTRSPARSSSSSRPTRRSCRTSATGSRSARPSESRAPAAPARTRAAT